MSAHGEAKSPKGPVLAAVGTGLAVILCCLLAPVLIGATWMLSLAPLVEAALVVVALGLGVTALRRHRADGC
jgi:hypothetical protein